MRIVLKKLTIQVIIFYYFFMCLYSTADELKQMIMHLSEGEQIESTF